MFKTQKVGKNSDFNQATQNRNASTFLFLQAMCKQIIRWPTNNTLTNKQYDQNAQKAEENTDFN